MNIYAFSIINCFFSVFSAFSVVQKIFFELIGIIVYFAITIILSKLIYVILFELIADSWLFHSS